MENEKHKERPRPSGLPIDSSGGPTIDPTANVIALVQAEKERSDDLREWEIKYFDAVTIHLKEISGLRAEHMKELRANDIERNANIRQVDITNQSAAAAQTQVAIQTLAKTSADTAAALAKQLSDRDTRIDERVGQLERNQSVGEGKQRVADPQMERLATLVEQLARNQVGSTSEGKGMEKMIGWLVAGVATLIGVAGYLSK